MADEVSIPKPKRELTEAQKLAFLKGREKRLANIEKKRLEKEEAAANTVAEPEPEVIPKVVTPPPKIATPEIKPEPAESFHFDMDTLADKVVERMLKAQAPPQAPAKPKPVPRPKVIPQQFTWL